ncbi:MAG: Tetratricopeptide repeat, partial [Solirubrobacteraceae bacterium]|nr:Tetratricopeptide repeat [Solirubrobacteraceae bacterium]
WMHLLPGLTGVALLGAAVLLRPAGREDEDEDPAAAEAENRAGAEVDDRAGAPPRSRRVRLATTILVGIAITVAALSFSRQTLSELYVKRAQDALARDPSRALVESNRALRLDREAIAAYYAKAAALARFGDGGAAQAVMRDATRREPRNFVTWALLGDLSVRRGELHAARSYYRRAARLNPRDPGLAKLATDPRAATTQVGPR